MTRRRRANFSAEDKVRILREHLLDGAAVSALCDKYGLRPSQFYTWQKQFFENGAAAFARKREPESARLEREVERLEERLANREEVIAELSSEYVALKKVSWGPLAGSWVAPELRDEVVRTLELLARRTEIPLVTLVGWLGVSRSKFYDWRRRKGHANHHNGRQPRDFWLLPWEKQAILDYQADFPDVGYRRMAYQMLDEHVVAVSPASVYRVLSEAERMRRWARGPSKKGKGFVQPDAPHRVNAQ
jgi:putative transposase